MMFHDWLAQYIPFVNTTIFNCIAIVAMVILFLAQFTLLIWWAEGIEKK